MRPIDLGDHLAVRRLRGVVHERFTLHGAYRGIIPEAIPSLLRRGQRSQIRRGVRLRKARLPSAATSADLHSEEERQEAAPSVSPPCPTAPTKLCTIWVSTQSQKARPIPTRTDFVPDAVRPTPSSSVSSCSPARWRRIGFWRGISKAVSTISTRAGCRSTSRWIGGF